MLADEPIGFVEINDVFFALSRGFDELSRVKVTRLLQQVGDDERGEAFAIRHNDVRGLGREVVNEEDAVKDATEFGEKDFQAFEQRRAFCFGNHIVHHLAVTLLECFEFGHVGFIAIGSLFHQSDETVGHSAERRNHHNHRTFRPADNISDMKDALTRANGRSSEFEYFHFDNV